MRNFKPKKDYEKDQQDEILSKFCPKCSSILKERYDVRPITFKCETCGFTRFKTDANKAIK